MAGDSYVPLDLRLALRTASLNNETIQIDDIIDIYTALQSIKEALEYSAVKCNAIALESITFGQIVTFAANGSSLGAYLANATAAVSRLCFGFSVTPGTVAAGNPIQIQFGLGIITAPQFVATPGIGGRCWLSTTAGQMSSSLPPAGAGNVVQAVGVYLGNSRVAFIPTLQSSNN